MRFRLVMSRIGSVLFTVLGSLVAFDRYRAAKLRLLRSAMAALRGANEALDIESAISRILAQSTGESDLINTVERSFSPRFSLFYRATAGTPLEVRRGVVAEKLRSFADRAFKEPLAGTWLRWTPSLSIA